MNNWSCSVSAWQSGHASAITQHSVASTFGPGIPTHLRVVNYPVKSNGGSDDYNRRYQTTCRSTDYCSAYFTYVGGFTLGRGYRIVGDFANSTKGRDTFRDYSGTVVIRGNAR